MSSAANDTAEGLGVGETAEIGVWRLHRYACTLVATDLTFAGKRGKKVSELRLSYWGKETGLPIESMTIELVGLARRGEGFDRMAQAFRESAEIFGLEASTTTYRGVNVEPRGATLQITTEGIELEATGRGFLLVNRKDSVNACRACEPQDAPIQAVKAFRAWVEANRSRIEAGLSFAQITSELHSAGVRMHSWCGMD